MIRVTDKYAFFYKEWPSNFFRSNFTYKGNSFFCTEQAFMWEKAMFFKDTDTAEKILACESPWTAKELGREVKNYVDAEWDKVRYQVMLDVNMAKYEQNPTLAGKLVGRKYAGRTFVEASPVDNILCLLSAAISAYSAVQCAPDRHLRSTVSHFISDYQSLDQHLSTTLSAPVSRLISACQLLDHCPLSRLKSTNAAAR